MSSVTIPNSVTSIGASEFDYCYHLSSVTIGNNVTSIGNGAFGGCSGLIALTVDPANPSYGSVDGVLFDKSLTTLIQFPRSKFGSYTVPNLVTSISDWAFQYSFIASITMPPGLTNIGVRAIAGCTNLASVYFLGNAPVLGAGAFADERNNPVIYYLPGTMGWDPPFLDIFSYDLASTALWVLPNPLILAAGPGVGVGTNGFGFIVSWATNVPVVVEGSANLEHPNWEPLVTNSLAGGSYYFSDPQWTNHPNRFYRVRSP